MGCGTDGRMDGGTDGVKPIYPPTTSLCEGYNNREEVSYLEKMVTRLSFWCTLYQDTLDVHQLAYVIMMVADTLATSRWQVNSLVPGRCGCNLKLVKLTWKVHILSISCEIALRWIPQDFTVDESTLVQVMAWCRQATSHYLGQCWPRSISPYDITRPQWVNLVVKSVTGTILYNMYHIAAIFCGFMFSGQVTPYAGPLANSEAFLIMV